MTIEYRIVEALDDGRRSPFGQWFARLDTLHAVKVRSAIARLEAGNFSNVSWIRGIGEYRIDWGPGLRIYFALESRCLIVLLGGGSKRRQQVDIESAIAVWKAHKKRVTQDNKD
jgi:putative addiction module killer protein